MITAELLQVDYAVVGQGEITDVELIHTLINHGDVSYVKETVYRTRGRKRQANAV